MSRKAPAGLQLSFLGGADTVTGSKTLVEHRGGRVLVDCGLFQGVRRNRLRNRAPLPFDPASLDAVLLTHAHLDHSGYLPALARDGFRGPIYCTPPTRALARILLPDSAHLLAEDARYANRKGFSRHSPALPLYTSEDAELAASLLECRGLGEPTEIAGSSFTFRGAGHILGAASVRLESPHGTVLFSGDLGRTDDLLMEPPEPPDAVDWIVVESTYGDRLHDSEDPIEAIAHVVTICLERGGTLLIPSFAVGRTQSVLYCLVEAFERGLAPRVPVYVDSPMATNSTHVFRRFAEYHRLDPAQCEKVFSAARYVRTPEESQALASRDGGRHIIVSASGMATGGRVLHHLKHLLPDPANGVLMPGFQAPGTRGELLTGGARQVKIHGGLVPVRARVHSIDLLSAHADQSGLVAWLRAAPALPRRIFVNHGEPKASDCLSSRIEDELKVPTLVPEHGASFVLTRA